MSLISSIAKHFKAKWLPATAVGIGGVMEYRSHLGERDKPVTAALKTIGSQALWYLYPAAMTAIHAAPFLSAAGTAMEANRRQAAGTMMFGAQTFGPRDVLDNAYLATNRARALTAINQSKLNARNIIGQEAALMSARYSGAGSIGGAGYNSFYGASY